MIKLGALLLLISGLCEAKVLMNQEEALRLIFPARVTVDRKTLFLKPEQIQRIQKMAKSKLESEMINYYVGKTSSGITGYAFFETHVVRTMPETFMVALNPQGGLNFVELLAFHEPEDYQPPKKWLGLFQKKELNDELWLKRGIRNIAGATLTAQAVTDGIRRILAIYQVAVKP